ncbi:hypothetical protein ACFQ0M_50105 [Kitasatospora aburaviensis]
MSPGTPLGLRLGAGHDLSYHHGLELVFGDPLFVMCPATFQDPVFREPRPDEIRLVSGQVGEMPAVLVAFEADAGGSELASGLIGAGRLDVVQGSSSGTGGRTWRPGAPGSVGAAPEPGVPRPVQSPR